VLAGGEQGGDENEVDVQINDDNIEVIVVQMDDVQEEMVPGDIEYVDLLPADAEAVFEFRDIFDVFLSDVDEEVSKYNMSRQNKHFFFFLNCHI